MLPIPREVLNTFSLRLSNELLTALGQNQPTTAGIRALFQRMMTLSAQPSLVLDNFGAQEINALNTRRTLIEIVYCSSLLKGGRSI
jgi:hypothetical protein